ncbi:hypothetical protein LguiA_009574 [Lonicera macranthoides]
MTAPGSLAWLNLVMCWEIQRYGYNVISAAANESEIKVYEIKRGNFSVKISNYGATVVSNDTTYFGAIVGRVANRIGGARFTLNGIQYKTPVNDNGKNTLHGFPGELSVAVTYAFIGSNKLAVKMQAKPLNKATPVNLASHTYWNLAGQNSGDILSHAIQLFGSNITPVDSELIPTGQIVPVQGTPYDFLQPAVIGSQINNLPDGYDINYLIDNKREEHLKKAAMVYDSKSGRRMELWTNKPGVQFYTSNMLDNVKGKGGFVYKKHAAFCLETQGFPDSVNHPNFPSQIVYPRGTYEHIMVYRFTASKRNYN